MGHKRPTEVTRSYLEAAPLPQWGPSYTVVSHKQVMDRTTKLLEDSGFAITRELYRANLDAKVAQGIYHIKPKTNSAITDPKVLNETELGMMFAWTNSYDKTIRFQCAIGGYVGVCYNGMVAGDLMNFKRKHTGAADHDIHMQISNQIKNAEKIYKRIIDDRDALRNTPLTKEQQAALLGRLYFNEELLDNTQMTCCRNEMNKPSYDYNCDQDNAWTFYNHVTHAFKTSHPRTWLSDTQTFHDFITAEVLGQHSPVQVDNTYNALSKYSELNIDEDEDWLEVPNTVDIDDVQLTAQHLIKT